MLEAVGLFTRLGDALHTALDPGRQPAAAPLGLRRVRAADGPQAQPDQPGVLVPAGTTLSQILDYVGGTGDLWPLDFYQAGLPLSRDVAVSYATLNRCVTLVAGGIAELLTCGGSLRAVDRAGNEVKTRRVRAIVAAFSESIDGGQMPSLNTIEDLAADYCLDGNALLVPEWGMDGALKRLRRMSPWDSDLFEGSGPEGSPPVYRLTPANDADGQLTEYHAPRDVVHIRWPRLLRYGRTRSTREGFALAPVVAMRPALDIGIRGDAYIRQWFTDGARSKLHVNFDASDGMAYNTDQRAELVKYVQRATASRRPLVTFNGSSQYIRDTPSDSQVADLRAYQVAEVSRVYGVPAPLNNVDMTSWGSGIEQLARLWWRFGLKYHLHRFTAALSLRLLPPGVTLAVNPFELLRGDSKEMMGLIRVMGGHARTLPLASDEELRTMAGMPREVDGELADTAPAPASLPPSGPGEPQMTG